MNNKIFFSLMLSVFSFAIASENIIPYGDIRASEQKIEALIKVKQVLSEKETLDKYVGTGNYEALQYGDLPNGSAKRNEFTVQHIDGENNYFIDIAGFSSYKGTRTGESNIIISMDSQNSVFFQRRINGWYVPYRLYDHYKDKPFYVHFLKQQDESDVISLIFTEQQVQEIMQIPLIQKSSAMRSILAVFGVVGFVALVYTWIFILKAWRY